MRRKSSLVAAFAVVAGSWSSFATTLGDHLRGATFKKKRYQRVQAWLDAEGIRS
jgi:hypothetical protein